MALVLLDFDRLGRQALFLFGFALATLAMRRAFVRLPGSDRWYLALIWLAACGLAADWAGLHYMVGAFLAGVVMDGRWFHRERMDLLRHHLLLVVKIGRAHVRIPVTNAQTICRLLLEKK